MTNISDFQAVRRKDAVKDAKKSDDCKTIPRKKFLSGFWAMRLNAARFQEGPQFHPFAGVTVPLGAREPLGPIRIRHFIQGRSVPFVISFIHGIV